MTTATQTKSLSSVETATLLRKHLKRVFPAVKFSVRSDYNSIRVSWTDGPTSKEVEAITSGYKGGGFDGMIDMQYSSDSWLLPDGTIQFASTTGTGGSRGSVPAVSVAPPPGAVKVRLTSTYVFTTRHYTVGFLKGLLAQYVEKYGTPAVTVKAYRGSDEDDSAEGYLHSYDYTAQTRVWRFTEGNDY